MLAYLIILVITFLGLFTGLLIGWLAKEELKPGRKYLSIFKHVLFIAILIIFFVKNWSVLFVIFIAGLIIIYSFSKHWETLYYYALAVIFFLSWRYNGFAFLGPLIFLYGFPIGSIYLLEHMKVQRKQVLLGVLRQYSGFLIIGVLLGLLGLVI
ncbi:MAG TPA: hypothetical protein ENL16_00900 [Candidatus Woesearchaeota archaeon]|nr:hypothetical protein [Candidatus Woesearchaeota archaeon]